MGVGAKRLIKYNRLLYLHCRAAREQAISIMQARAGMGFCRSLRIRQ
jgi:hypothetical protein